MQKLRYVLLLFVVLTAGYSFSEGIEFLHISYKEALRQAKEQDKLIFIDFHTEWCGPCKKLAATTFMEKANGDFFNTNFINIKLDAEKEGKEAATIHKVLSFPTLLFVNGDGNIVHQAVGIGVSENFIGFGKEALNAANSQYSWEKLQAMYPQKQQDESFLKMYMTKMQELGLKPVDAIEAWLKVQTEIPENGVDMMHFLLNNQGDLEIAGKADSILTVNLAKFSELASMYERKQLDRLPPRLLLNTLDRARRSENAALLKKAINRIKKSDPKPRGIDDQNKLQLNYFRYLKDYPSFKKYAEFYVDSLINVKSIAQIREEDQKFFTMTSKGYTPGSSKTKDMMVSLFKEGKTANSMIEDITEVGEQYLKYIDTKAEYKNLNNWINYCYKLVPGKYWIDNLKADMLYKQGNVTQAIELKKRAVDKMPFTVKKKVNFEHELNEMIMSSKQ